MRPIIHLKQLGFGCNVNDEFELTDFAGKLSFVYAQKTDEMQTGRDNWEPMTTDFGGVTPCLNLSCEHVGEWFKLPLHPLDTIELAHWAGKTVKISYEPIPENEGAMTILLVEEAPNVT